MCSWMNGCPVLYGNPSAVFQVPETDGHSKLAKFSSLACGRAYLADGQLAVASWSHYRVGEGVKFVFSRLVWVLSPGLLDSTRV